ncbi:hypothetical protein NAS2_1343 [Conexivisphaera calida]|uniref:Cas12f1-like TNB domain-containing protein n=1 Tax=Conexivisphaera calida TaxID=1874277 RepID=A0A4P2VF00_9ARCH|nr:hypothetical protein NAS2_1343 [Conexivisphaera calida]
MARTVVVRSARLPGRTLDILAELRGMYRDMVELLVQYAVENEMTSFMLLKAEKYGELRSMHPELPSHYAYTACQDAATRSKSFLRSRRRGRAKGRYPEVRRISMWLDDHLWRPDGLTAIRISTHRGWVKVELEPSRQYWRYLNGGWSLRPEARIRLDPVEDRLIVYLTFEREVEEYEPKGFVSVDVNEDNVTALVDGAAYLLRTDMKEMTLGYDYRRRRIMERNSGSRRAMRKVIRKSGYRRRKEDVRRKAARIIVGAAAERGYGIALERLGKRPNENMIRDVGNPQLRYRIFQAAFKGIQREIEEEAMELGVPVVHVNPKNTSRMCPIHRAPIVYDGSRVGKCSEGGESWHRDVAATWNILRRALGGDGSAAPSPLGPSLDGRPMPLASTGAHDPTVIARIRGRGASPCRRSPRFRAV